LAKKINFEIENQNEQLPLYMRLAGRKQSSKAFKPKYEFKMTEEDALNVESNPSMKEMISKLEQCSSNNIDDVFSSFMGSNSISFKTSYQASKSLKKNPKMTSY
tara:strand:- start:221 stop:532 length:312 start_codon:yes stop_codon:yes gene_type:complete